MIPKVIHYCWFGGNELTEKEIKCINSWKKYCPDYEIVRWDESNFDVKANQYCCEAYEQKKWAFVSDYARFLILYENGGLYFDTDVELIKPIQDIVDEGPFMGMERTHYDNITLAIATGLCLGAETGMDIYRTILDYYDSIHFLQKDGFANTITVVKIVTDIFLKHGFQQIAEIQKIDGVNIYPPDYFCPLNYQSGCLEVTSNTRSIHHYNASWLSNEELRVRSFKRFAIKILGESVGNKIGDMYGSMNRLWNRIKNMGIKKTIEYYKKVFTKS